MLKAQPGKELHLHIGNGIEALSTLSKILAERGVNILAVSYWREGNAAAIRLVTDDILRTTDVLTEHDYEFAEKQVVLVNAEHKPGILRHISAVLAQEGISLTHLFASATINQNECLVVLNSTDNDHAIVLLNR